MRNLKKLLAVLVSVAVMLTAVIPAFAAEAAKTPAQIAEQLGVLKGGTDGVTDAYLALGTKRIQAAIMLLRLKGLEETARAYTESTVNFKDAKDVSGDTVNLLAYLKNTASLGWQGGPSGNFTPNADATPQMLYKALLEALGYKQGTDFEYSDVLGFAKALGMGDIASKTKITNGDLATAVVEALGAKMKDSNQTLAEKIAEDNATFATKAAELGLINTATIDALAAVTIAYGADAAAVKAALPEIVTVKYVDGTSTKKAVAWGALDTSKEGDVNLEGTVDGIGAKATIKVTVAQMPLSYTLSATNYKEVVVTFNKAVASDLLKKDNFTVNGATPDAVTAAADGKSAILLAATEIAKQGSFEVVAKKALGFADDTKIKLENVIDTAPAVIENVEAVGNSAIKITFNEPVTKTTGQVLSNFKLNGVYFGAVAPDVTGRVITITPSTRLAAGVNKITIANIKDFADYTSATVTDKEFVVATDTTAASVVKVESATQTKVVIEMSEEIEKPATGDISGVTANSTSVDGTKLTIEFTVGNALPTTEKTITLKNITDKFNNKAADLAVKVTASPDTTRPAFVGITNDPDNNGKRLIVEFSKEVNLDGSISMLDSDGKLKNISGTERALAALAYYVKDSTTYKNKIVLKLTDDAQIKPTSYTITIKDFTDINPLSNKILPVVTSATIEDKTKPTVANTYKYTTGNKLYVEFSEELDKAVAETKSNYSYTLSTGLIKSLNADTTVALAGDKKTVVITFPSAAGDNQVLIGNIASLQISGIKDLGANVLDTVAYNFGSFAERNTAPSISAPLVTGAKTIELTVAAGVGAIDATTININDFTIYNDAGTRIYPVAIAWDADNSKITLTTSETFTTDGLYQSVNVNVYSVSTPTLANVYGLKLAGGQTYTCDDGYAPAVVADTVTKNYTGGNTVIKVEVTEDVDYAGSDAPQFRVYVDGAVTAANVAYFAPSGSDKGYFTFTILGTDVTGKTLKVKFNRTATATVVDNAGVALADFEVSK